MKITIADNLFMQYAKTAHLGGENININPDKFEWELAEPTTARFVTDSLIKHARGPGQVAWLLEPFFLHPENYIDAMGKGFDAVLTHNKSFAVNKRWLWYPHGGSRIEFAKWGVQEKTKNISIVLSKKNTMRGHQLRHEIVERFGDKLDVLGLGELIDMYDGLAPYRYSIIIENEQAPGYFTEKLIDCLSVGTIPIYWGCLDFGNYFDRNGILPFLDLENIGILLSYGEDYYADYKNSIANNFNLAKHYAICEDWIYKVYPQLFGGSDETKT